MAWQSVNKDRDYYIQSNMSHLDDEEDRRLWVVCQRPQERRGPGADEEKGPGDGTTPQRSRSQGLREIPQGNVHAGSL